MVRRTVRPDLPWILGGGKVAMGGYKEGAIFDSHLMSPVLQWCKH